MERRVVIDNLPLAFRIIKEMNLSAERWESDYWVTERESVMEDRISRYWEKA